MGVLFSPLVIYGEAEGLDGLSEDSVDQKGQRLGDLGEISQT
jgi:hypothetical protein